MCYKADVVLDRWLAGEKALWMVIFFFFKQKTAYEMLRSLVGSEMCIRDRDVTEEMAHWQPPGRVVPIAGHFAHALISEDVLLCLLYTSDAADDLLCVDLGGRRVLKKQNPVLQRSPTA